MAKVADIRDTFKTVFTEPGTLGLAFGSDSPEGKPFVNVVRPGTQAARKPELRRYQMLLDVDGAEVTSFQHAMALLKASSRPVTLTFAQSKLSTASMDAAQAASARPPANASPGEADEEEQDQIDKALAAQLAALEADDIDVPAPTSAQPTAVASTSEGVSGETRGVTARLGERTVKVEVLCCINLPKLDSVLSGGSADPFVRLRCGASEHTTAIISNSRQVCTSFYSSPQLPLCCFVLFLGYCRTRGSCASTDCGCCCELAC
eukprot:COSAG05_NODE_1609_length_4412_cov_2.348018_2_plen_263_part_00